ncbi:MAG: carboxymuconolactone decarboxylase family protein [Xenophilus sp.]
MDAPRITAPPLDALDGAQRRLLERTVAALGAVIGPRTLLVHDMRVAEAWAALGDALKNSALPARARELAILIVARHWRAGFEWQAHAAAARNAGLPEAAIEALRLGRPPMLEDPVDIAVHGYATALVRDRSIDDPTYTRAWQALGTVALVDLTALIGHYTSVAMTLVAHRLALPPGVADPFAGS